jgi:hypothetical protein
MNSDGDRPVLIVNVNSTSQRLTPRKALEMPRVMAVPIGPGSAY